MENSNSILIIDDDEDILTSARLLLKQEYGRIYTSSDPQSLNQLMAKHQPDIILLDMNFRKGHNDGREGLYWLTHIKEINSETQVILMTAYGEVELAVAAIKKGAFDFVLKPWTNEKLITTVENALKFSREHKKVVQLEHTKKNLEESIGLKEEDFVTRSHSMKNVMRTIEKVAATDANVLLLGENGTGKSVLAMALHRLSNRHRHPFITVDLGAVHSNLFESELFGHKKGAFTDARDDRPGRFEVADEGTLFLDEIGNLDLSLQSKLLTVLQNRRLTRLGENRDRSFNVRLISATNMPIEKMVEEGSFRQDLLYRINTVELVVPPLRERKEDIPILAKRFLEKYSRKYKREGMKLNSQAIDRLCKYSWPGNIRELEHAIERAVILGDGKEIGSFSLQLNSGNEKLPDSYNLEEMEKHLIVKAMEKFQGNISRAAGELGITRAALYRRMEKHDL